MAVKGGTSSFICRTARGRCPFSMSTNSALQELHDQLLANQPEGATHPDSESCPFCVEEADGNQATPGGSMPESFSQEDVDAAVAAATASLQKRLDELGAQVQETETGRAVADAVAAKDQELSQLREQLDAAEASRTALEQKLAETEQFWTDAIASSEAAAAFAARRADRIAQASEAGVFSSEYVEENADRFAAMSDEDFSARLDEWRLIASQSRSKSVGGDTSQIPSQTALVASRAEEPTGSALAFITQFKAQRVDPRDLGGA